MKMEPKCIKNHKNDALGASGGLCGASRLQNGWWTAAPLRKGCRFFKKSDLGRHF
jgi:hypothetical protein